MSHCIKPVLVVGSLNRQSDTFLLVLIIYSIQVLSFNDCRWPVHLGSSWQPNGCLYALNLTSKYCSFGFWRPCLEVHLIIKGLYYIVLRYNLCQLMHMKPVCFNEVLFLVVNAGQTFVIFVTSNDSILCYNCTAKKIKLK